MEREIPTTGHCAHPTVAVFNNRVKCRTEQRGFSLTGQMFALALVGSLAAMAVPSFYTLVLKHRLASHVNLFVASINLGRSEAVTRIQQLVMCRSLDLETCSRSPGWHAGWILFVDNNLNREHDPDEQQVRIQEPFDNGVIISSGTRRRIVFQPTGTTPGTNATYTFCMPGHPELARAIILSNIGRARLSFSGPRGRSLPCA